MTNVSFAIHERTIERSDLFSRGRRSPHVRRKARRHRRLIVSRLAFSATQRQEGATAAARRSYPRAVRAERAGAVHALVCSGIGEEETGFCRTGDGTEAIVRT